MRDFHFLKVKDTQEVLDGWLIQNWMPFKVAFVAHWVERATEEQGRDPSKINFDVDDQKTETDPSDKEGSVAEVTREVTPNYEGELEWLTTVGSVLRSQTMKKSLKYDDF